MEMPRPVQRIKKNQPRWHSMQLVSSDPSVFFLEKSLLEVALFERDSFDFLINKYEVASWVLEQV